MAYPNTIDNPDVTMQGGSLVATNDHALDHRQLGSAVIAIENKLGVGVGSAAANQILVGSGAGTATWGSVLTSGSFVNPNISGGTLNNVTLGTPTLLLGSDAPRDLYFRSASGTLNRLPAGTAGQVLQTNGTASDPSWGANSLNTDGWVSVTDTWTYLSATSFKITGVDRTLVYTKGTRIKCTNNSIVVYGVVASSSFSSDTTVNLIPTSDYSLNNSAITLPFYSYQVNPQGYPTWFNFTTAHTGFSSNPPGYMFQYTVTGNAISVYYDGLYAGGAGTSNATTYTITLPVPVVQNESSPIVFKNAGTYGTGVGLINLASGSVASLYIDPSTTGWNGTGLKGATTDPFVYKF